MKRFPILALGIIVLIGWLAMPTPAHANVTELVLHTRTCGTVTAFILYDTFSEGTSPFWAAFAVDLNGNGVFGEADEPVRYVRVFPTQGQAEAIGARLTFPAVPEGSTIAVTAYEVDSAGVAVSPQISPVSYQCTHRPAKNPLPPNTDIAVPGVGIVAKIRVTAVTVFDGPSATFRPLGGLGKGTFANVLARNERGDWLQIQFKGQKGWIMWQTQAILFGPYAELPVLPNVETPPTATVQ